MSTTLSPNLKHPLFTLVKVGYNEMSSIVLISGAFWLFTLPVVSLGASLLALFDVIESIYQGESPSRETERLRYFSKSVRANFIRGVPLSALVMFVFANTVWYFTIVLSGQALYYILGGLVGIYVCILAIMFSFRAVNIISQSETNWRTAIRRAGTSWGNHPQFTVLQITIATIAMLVSIAVPVALFLLLPSVLALFELVSYKEMTGTDPRTVLTRYRKAI